VSHLGVAQKVQLVAFKTSSDGIYGTTTEEDNFSIYSCVCLNPLARALCFQTEDPRMFSKKIIVYLHMISHVLADRY
jgi:hypothetical protein